VRDPGSRQDEGTGSTSLQKLVTIKAPANDESFLTIPAHWVFAATSGTHTYALQTHIAQPSGPTVRIDNPVLTAQYIPFGHNGGSTLSAR
jgi:hypothetical protein